MGEIHLMVDNQDECTICLEPLLELESDKIRTLDCTHKFHEDCIKQWSETSNNNASCPLCRVVFTTDANRTNETLVEEFTQITFKDERNFVLWLSGFNCIFSAIQLMVNSHSRFTFMFSLINNLYGFYGALKLNTCYLYTYLIFWLFQFVSIVLNIEEMSMNHYERLNALLLVFVTLTIAFDIYIVVTIARLVRKIRNYRLRIRQRIVNS